MARSRSWWRSVFKHILKKEHLHVTVLLSNTRGENHAANTTCSCVCVWEPCAVLCGSSVACSSGASRGGPGQDRAGPLVIPTFSGALARTWWASARKRLRSLVRFSLTVSRSLFYSLLFLTPQPPPSPPTPHPLEPLCEWVNSKCLLSSSAGPLYDALDIRWKPVSKLQMHLHYVFCSTLLATLMALKGFIFTQILAFNEF